MYIISLYSGPDSFVFVNLVDHGAPGLFAFPEEYVSATAYHLCCHDNIITLQLHAKRLNEVIQEMHNNKKYKQMVIYMESCESGSIFDGLLSHNINGILCSVTL